MTTRITVREYARLTTDALAESTLDRAHVSSTAFDWLCRLSADFTRAGASLVHVEGRRWLALDNFVGVLETPCGTSIEILPKHVDDEGGAGDIAASRRLLRSMIAAATGLRPRDAGPANLERFSAPLGEWLMGRFVSALDHLVKRGMQSDYIRVDAAERFLRGQLDITKQMRQPVGRAHIFQFRHDVFGPDRAENRLIKLALERVAHATQTPSYWQLANELRALLHAIPSSSDVTGDFCQWRNDRLMAHYQPLRPLCELILHQHMPLALRGAWHGISLLFPMEKLFERYVSSALARQLPAGATMYTQPCRASLCKHLDANAFRLQPDLLIEHGQRKWVLDTKWKRLDGANREGLYGLAQSDFYQLFAYGHKYLFGHGEMALIYPRTAKFTRPPPPFVFSEGLTLWALPFNLENEQLIGIEKIGLQLEAIT
ncbi:McrC family protein [Caballeronia sordidicola]|uniref:McrBC 5-methylcytosine restriction system component n=1 Tax=Caballeronia sordidicola TaxID=196367 RepID=A0A242MEM2_CABSO|nr:McrC family protein [Caballeronia sordidicola]OTP69753.1 McrBC 5-methylcytosine restriction system component [Caballeronia sordidicola]